MMGITKITCCSILRVAVLLGMGLAGCNHEKNETYTVGLINILPDFDQTLVGFKEGMTELGYVEGKNIHYIYHGPTQDRSTLPEEAQALIAANVDLILSLTTPATLAAKQAAAHSTLPIVFSMVTDPLEAGIVDSMQHPGGNITGVTSGFQEARRLEWLVRIAPSIKHVYVPVNPKDQGPVSALRMVRSAAAGLGVTLIVRELHNLDMLDEAVLNIPDQADAIFFLPDSFVATRLADIVKAANNRHLPTSVASINAIKDYPILTSLGADQYVNGKQTARMVEQIFKGIEPGDLPVEISELYLAINLKVADTIGLTIPVDLLRQADLIVR